MIKFNTPTKIIIFIIVFVMVGVSGFFSGLKFGQLKGSLVGGMPPGGDQASFGQPSTFGGSTVNNRQRGAGGVFVDGEIVSVDDKSLTVKMPDSGSRTIYWSDSTIITKSDSGSVGDLTVGTQVMITGTSADSTTTAKSIQILPVAQIPTSQKE